MTLYEEYFVIAGPSPVIAGCNEAISSLNRLRTGSARQSQGFSISSGIAGAESERHIQCYNSFVDELAREYVVSFYDKALRIFGDRPESLGWTERGQRLHFESMLDIADSIDGKKILDFGCGKGDFYRFLKERDVLVEYTGLDINEKLLSKAKDKFPEGRFRFFDIEKDHLDEDFDYIFLCGVFNLKVQGIEKAMRSSLIKLFLHCRKALAFNALSARNPKKDFELHYVSPEEIFAFAVENLSPFVSLRHDRMAYDFTMFVYREINFFP